MMELWETGLPVLWGEQFLRQATNKADKCFAKIAASKSTVSTRPVPIKLEDFKGAYFILGIGTSLSFLCFLVEKIAYVYHHNTKGRSQRNHDIALTDQQSDRNAVIQIRQRAKTANPARLTNWHHAGGRRVATC